MRRFTAVLLATGLAACAPRRPPFVEPDWGDAPSPYPVEITEITREYRHCAARCSFDRMVFRRDGTVTRRFFTEDRLDSLLTARIDSLGFIELVTALDRAGLFRPMGGAGEHVPLAVDSYLISAATLCRRAVATYSPLSGDWYPGSQAVLAVERAVSRLHWMRWRPDDAQLSRARPREEDTANTVSRARRAFPAPAVDRSPADRLARP